MSRKTRTKLKKLFSNGRMPSEGDFSDLVDSAINPLDDGFDITQEEGIKIAPTEMDVFASIYSEKGDMNHAKWRFEIGDNDDYLLIQNNLEQSAVEEESLTSDNDNDDLLEDSDPILSISASEGKIGVNKKKPDYNLDIDGVLASNARLGSMAIGTVDADGQWHDVLTGLDGCHMLEVTAGVAGGEKQGRYALLRAVAMNCYNPDYMFSWFRKRIKHQHAWYLSRWDRIKLRWEKDGTDNYKLQIKTIRNYRKGNNNFQIKYHVTQLWVETNMRYSYQDDES